MNAPASVKPYAKPPTPLALALAYIKKHPGRKLFPCRGKSGPCIKDNLAKASNDPAQLREWATEFAGPDLMWACSPKACEPEIFCIDVDTGTNKKTGKPNIGAKSWRVLRDDVFRADGVQLAETERNTTPSGGAHFIFEGEHKLSIGRLGRTPDLPPDQSSNVDCPNYFMIPGQGGYVVKNDIPAMKAPPTLQLRVKPPRPERNREPSGDAIPLDTFRKMLSATTYSGGPDGMNDRHTYMGWLSFMFAAHDAAGGNEGDYLEAFIDWSLNDPNQDWNTPTSRDLIEYKWQSITDADLVAANAITRGSWIEYLKATGNAELAAQAAAARSTAAEAFADVDGPPLSPEDDAIGSLEIDPFIVEDGKRRNRMKGRSFAELDGLPDPKFIVDKMVPEDGLIVVYGKPKRGKSFWALELSWCMATGTPFFGEKLGRTGPVIYVAAEGGAAAVRNRLRNWLNARKVDPNLLRDNWLLVDTSVLLNNKPSVDNFLALNPGDKAMTFIDTLARCMNGDENSAKDMGAAIKGADYIREKTKGGVLIVHHEGWSAKRVRGSSVLQGAPDAVIRVARDDGNVTMVLAEDMRESASGRRMDFTLDPKLGVLSILSADDMAARSGDDKAITILGQLQSENGGEPVEGDAWRKMLTAAGLVDGDKTKSTGRNDWARIVKAAVKSKRVKKLPGDLFEVRVSRDDLNDNASTSDDEAVQ
jgi:hypothetical protein